MLKKLQQLKAKKGFTLVELIVVIAIIGVLAAILIPTMLNYITGARVTSLNSSVSSIKNDVTGWYTDLDGKGFSVDRATSYTITINASAGNFTATIPSGFFKGSAPSNANSALQEKMSELYPQIKNASINLYVVNGAVVAALMTSSTSAVSGTYNTSTNKWTGLGMDTKKDGVTSGGEIFGSYPIATNANGDA